MKEILIADDHPIFRNGLKQVIEEASDMVVTGEADNGREALEKVLEGNYDLVLLDISMPDMNGLDVLREIKSQKPGVSILVMSMHPEEQYAVRALKSGASGYLTKRSAPYELMTAIKKICDGGKYIGSLLAEKLAFELDDTHEKPLHSRLSEREFQIMLMFGLGKTVTGIAKDLFLSAKTVSTYRSRILKKMKMKNNAEISCYVIKQGLVE